jgi:hypothetical protein
LKKIKFSAAKIVTILQGIPACENVHSGNISEWFEVKCTKLGNDSKTVRPKQKQPGETDQCANDKDS